MRTAKDNYWLDTPYEPNPALRGEQEVDVAIIGGGLTGLASAYFIKERFPQKRVIVLESEYVGFGASGRCSGGLSGIIGHNYTNLKKKYGLEEAAQLQRLISQIMPLLEEQVKKNNIDCDFRQGGRLVLAETENQLKRLEEEKKAADEIGGNTELLDGNAAHDRFGGRKALGALRYPDEGLMNPAAFMRGMKKVVESLGVEVYEHSRCTHAETGPTISLYTPLGQARARDIVVATNAYSNPLGLLKNGLLTVHLYQIVTEPLTKAQLDELHLPGYDNVFGATTLYWEVRLTPDDRVLFVKCDVLNFYDNERDYSHRPSEYKKYYKILTGKFPFLKGIKLTHQWGGRLALTLDSLPKIGRTGKHDNIYYGIGYNGCGVAPSQLVGKMLAALMAGERSELTTNMLINKPTASIPSAPLRYAAIKGLLAFYRLHDQMLERGK